jgi:2'-5' RNA ligase
MKNLFFALIPNLETTEHATELAHLLRRKLGLKGKPRTQHFHVSMHNLGSYIEVPDWLISKARQVAASVVAPPFELAFDHIASFSGKPDNRPLVLYATEGNAAVKAFQQTLGRELKSAQLIGKIDGSYTPHLTLLYDKPVAPQPVEPMRWIVREFFLVCNPQDGSGYELLGSWPLCN